VDERVFVALSPAGRGPADLNTGATGLLIRSDGDNGCRWALRVDRIGTTQSVQVDHGRSFAVAGWPVPAEWLRMGVTRDGERVPWLDVPAVRRSLESV
jgi:hypothetical protein